MPLFIPRQTAERANDKKDHSTLRIDNDIYVSLCHDFRSNHNEPSLRNCVKLKVSIPLSSTLGIEVDPSIKHKYPAHSAHKLGTENPQFSKALREHANKQFEATYDDRNLAVLRHTFEIVVAPTEQLSIKKPNSRPIFISAQKDNSRGNVIMCVDAPRYITVDRYEHIKTDGSVEPKPAQP